MATPLANAHDEAASITTIHKAPTNQHLDPHLLPLNVDLCEFRTVDMVEEMFQSGWEERAEKSRRLFEWNDDCIVDLIRFIGRLYNTHLDLILHTDASSLESAYTERYELLRREYTHWYYVWLNGMLTEYTQLIKAWVIIQKDFQTAENNVQDDMITRLARGMDSTIFFLLKNAMDDHREIHLFPLVTALGTTHPSKRLARGIFFLLEATRAEYNARKQVSGPNCLHKWQALMSHKMLEEVRYDQLFREQETRHRALVEDIESKIEELNGEIFDTKEEGRTHQHYMRKISKLLYAPASAASNSSS
ncbi:hypothetical protein PCANC_17460 [Puccinia coronata f. sp. avenae]|uniref:Uncharacterized protein n=1 Tax=Puccinia coronata f. sp. avenae TaxID=200324 RepID=A0A2N5SMC9_9BASI|nr:hypothetical protein PCANC_17460 [Puccinia coronata f. sp. avenae]